jgi:hypothetical protein
MTVSGTLANLNSALNGLTFTPASRFVGSASISVSVLDVGDQLTGSASIAVTVNKTGRAAKTASREAPSGGDGPTHITPDVIESDLSAGSHTSASVADALGNGAINLSTSGNTAIGVTANGVPQSGQIVNASVLILAGGERSNDIVGESSTSHDTIDSGDSSSADSAPDFWAGLIAAIETLG